MTTKRVFPAPKGLMIGLMIWITAAIVLNIYVFSKEADSPIPGALMLFAGSFNVFVATLNILLRLGGGGRPEELRIRPLESPSVARGISPTEKTRN